MGRNGMRWARSQGFAAPGFEVNHQMIKLSGVTLFETNGYSCACFNRTRREPISCPSFFSNFDLFRRMPHPFSLKGHVFGFRFCRPMPENTRTSFNRSCPTFVTRSDWEGPSRAETKPGRGLGAWG